MYENEIYRKLLKKINSFWNCILFNIQVLVTNIKYKNNEIREINKHEK